MLRLIEVDRDWREGDVPNRGAAVVKLESADSIALDSSMCMTEHNSLHAVG
jgi:hypothetical protein